MKASRFSTIRLPGFLLVLAIAAGYFILAKVSLLLSFESSNATPVWPPSGFAFAMVLLLGRRMIPGILIGAFAANVVVFLSNHTADTLTVVWVSLIISIGNTCEALLGYYLLNKMIPGISDKNYFLKVTNIFRFLLVAGIMCLPSSILGTTAILLGKIITADNYTVAWLTWWLGDMSGIILVTPFILIWVNFFLNPPAQKRNDRIFETAALFLLVILTSGIVFDNWFFNVSIFRLAFWAIPFVVWAAVRFNQHETITAIVICSITAIWGTVNNHGPFFIASRNESLLIVQSFISIIVITTLTLYASILEKNQIEEALRLAGNQLDIRVKKRTAELEERNRFIETLYDSVEDLMAVFDTKGNYLSVNKKIETMYKLTKEQMIGRHLLDVFPTMKESSMYANLQRAANGESIHDLGYRSIISNKYFENFYIPLKDKRQEIYGVLVIGHDNTAVMEAAEKIESINTKLNEAQRLAHIGSWQWDITGDKISWSNEMFRIYGQDPGEFEASYENFLHCVHADEREKVNKIVQDAYANHEAFDYYHRIIRPDGSIRTIHARGKVLSNEKNEAVTMMGTGQDVTEIKQAEEEIKQMADELIRYNRQLEQTNKELESFTFVASHDLQEPLRKIRTFLNLIAEQELETLSDPSKNYLQRTLNAAAQMQRLIIDLLAYSRTTSSEDNFKKTDLNAILQLVKSELRETIDEKKATIVSNGLPELNVIPFQFQQLFTNLISNSLKFSRPGIPPHISISYDIVKKQDGEGMNGVESKEFYALTIIDNGIGFESEYNERIFGLFQRLHSKNEYSGTGIGLSICKKIVENHRGIITAKGELNQGTTINIYLPVMN